MTQFSKFFNKLISQFTLTVALTFLVCTSLSAEVFKFDSVLFVRENNGYNKGDNWTQLEFRIQKPTIGNKTYRRDKISFTIDSSRNSNSKRTDLKFARDWLQSYKWSSRPGKNDIFLGSVLPNSRELIDLRKLSKDEKIIAAWIIANSDELIEFALNDNQKTMAASSRLIWKQLSKNNFFEKNIRQNLGRELSKQISNYDKSVKKSKFVLEKQIQPYLKSLKLYDGQVDGLWGSKTLEAIKKFERSVNVFPDGVLSSKERILLRDTAMAAETYSNPTKIKELIEKLNKRVETLSSQVSRQKELILERDNNIQRLRIQDKEGKELISKLEKELTQLKRNLSSARDKHLNRLKKISELEAKLRTSLTEISELKNRIASLSEASTSSEGEILIKKLENQLSELKRDFASLEINYDDAITERNSLSNRLKAQISKVAELREQLIAIENSDDEVSSEIKKLMAANDRLQKNLDQKAIEIKSLKTSKQEVQVRLDEAKLLIKSLRAGAGAEYKTWKDVEGSLSVQQQRFCSILQNFQKNFSASLSSANQIKVNNTIFERDQNIDALIPEGKFNNWVGRVVEIYQTPNLDAGYSIELHCAARFSTGQIDIDGNQQWVATAKRGGRIFNQLSKLSKNQFVVFSGTMVKYQDISNQELTASYVTKYDGDGEWTEWEQYFASATSEKDGEVKLLDTENTDFMFFADIDYLSQY